MRNRYYQITILLFILFYIGVNNGIQINREIEKTNCDIGLLSQEESSEEPLIPFPFPYLQSLGYDPGRTYLTYYNFSTTYINNASFLGYRLVNTSTVSEGVYYYSIINTTDTYVLIYAYDGENSYIYQYTFETYTMSVVHTFIGAGSPNGIVYVGQKVNYVPESNTIYIIANVEFDLYIVTFNLTNDTWKRSSGVPIRCTYSLDGTIDILNNDMIITCSYETNNEAVGVVSIDIDTLEINWEYSFKTQIDSQYELLFSQLSYQGNTYVVSSSFYVGTKIFKLDPQNSEAVLVYSSNSGASFFGQDANYLINGKYALIVFIDDNYNVNFMSIDMDTWTEYVLFIPIPSSVEFNGELYYRLSH